MRYTQGQKIGKSNNLKVVRGYQLCSSQVYNAPTNLSISIKQIISRQYNHKTKG